LNTENAARALLGVQKQQQNRQNDDGDRDSFLDD